MIKKIKNGLARDQAEIKKVIEIISRLAINYSEDMLRNIKFDLLIENLLPIKSLVMIHAKGGVGKSYFLLSFSNLLVQYKQTKAIHFL
ncbi:hypothetical protein [Campylobacter fetus]|uniref:hypothetical protein n=1 Tax=Campylobacter fetus TaxID=196 RepID=UPI0008187DC1|nr:hypothetical protein [Campylobacter fetus]EAK0826939.1 hypothetical protein [Campylobacter fetus]OCR93180.1 hypothetical protein CFT12S02263_02310 [Campylobacter fetus subsp. testudinum]